MRLIEVRTLKRRLFVDAPDNAAQSKLRFIECKPEIEGFDPTEDTLFLEPLHGHYRACFSTGHVVEGSADYLLSALHIHHFNESIREFPDALVIHGGTIQTERGTILVVGDKAAGKTTLMMRLALDGVQVMGDEHAFVTGNQIITRPRTLRLKEGTLAHLPASVSQKVRAQPHIEDWYGDPIYAVPPSLFLDTWTIRPGGLCAIIILAPNHGGRSRLREMDKTDAFPMLLRNCSEPSGNKLQGFMKLNEMCSAAPVFELRNGNLDGAVRLVHSLAN